MKKNNPFRKTICLLLSITFLLYGCGNKAGETEKHYVAIIAKSTESTFWKSVFAGAGAAATEYNLNITCEGPKTEEDYEGQNRLVADAVENGAEVIIFSSVDFDGNAEAINQAAAKGVKIVVIDSDVNSDAVSTRIGTDNYQAGCVAAEAALSDNRDSLHIGIVNYAVYTANGQQRENGFRQTIEQNERVKSIHTTNVVSTTEDARQGTIKLLQKYPDINVIATFNEWTSLGVGWAIRELGRADDITVVAFDSNVVSVGMMETGEVDALVVQSPYVMGYLAVEAAHELILGQKPENTHINTDIKLVTKENMFDADSQRILFSFE